MRHVQRGDLIDADTFERWAEGWARSRGKAPPVPEDGALRIEVGEPGHLRRYVFPRAPDGVAVIASRVRERGVFLKVPVPEADVRALLPRGWTVERTGTVMTVEDLPLEKAALPDGYGLTVVDDAGVTIAEVTTATGELAAKGRLVIVRGLAVHDRIRTEPAHQRRGLGRAVMTRLGAIARARGAQQGALVATDVGVLLYRRLGWRERAPYVTAEWIG